MKVHLYQEKHSGKLRFYDRLESWSNWQYLGEMEIEPKLPKKVVKYEKVPSIIRLDDGLELRSFILSKDVKNIRVIYEVEE